MPNWNFVKRQLKFDKPRYLFTKTHEPKTKTQMFYDKNNALFIHLMEKHHHTMKQWSKLLTETTFSITSKIWCNIKYVFHVKYVLY